MLIQFTVENFKSIKDEQTLSLVKNSANEMSDNYFTSNASATPDLLKTAVIYGANASGKSNLLKALASMNKIIENSFKKKLDESIVLEPFLLDPICRTQPTTFQAVFVVQMPSETGELRPTRVEYGFSADKKQIYEEWLSVYPKGREQSWFHRLFNDENKVFDWKDSNFFKGQKETWKKNTRPDQLFLSTAVHLNSEQLKPIYDWFTQNVSIINTDRISNKMSKNVCQQDSDWKRVIISLLQQADIDVEDIIIRKPNINLKGLPDDMPEEFKQQIIEELSENLDVFFVHLDGQMNRIEINLKDESDGTQKIFEFASLIFFVLHNNYTLIIDEFNKSLHPDLVRFLVKIFNSKHNDYAQLIFTTHETSILRKDLLRRDQIWFCEKGKKKSTSLYPLTDFNPHKNREDIEECYLHGRYGGKPIIKDFFFPEDLNISNDTES